MSIRLATFSLFVSVLFSITRPVSGDEHSAREILYVTNSAGNDVTVIDAATHRVIGSIETGPTPHGLVASPDGRRIYITGETDDDLVAIDTATSTVLWKAPVGQQPNEPALTADGRHVYVPIRTSDVTDVVDTSTAQRINTIRTGRVPHNAYRSPDGTRIYVTARGDEKITIIDPATQRVVGEVPLGGEPRPAAFTRDNKLTYVALTGLHGFVVADLDQSEVIDQVELPKADLPEVATGGYTDTHGLALNRDETQFWVTDVFGNGVTVFRVPEHDVLTRIPVGLAPNWMTFSPDGERLYVSNSSSDDVSVIDVTLLKEVVRIPVGSSPKRLLVVTVPEGMSGPEDVGWITAAHRPSTTDYYVRGGGMLGAETHSFRAEIAAGDLTVESMPARYRKLGLPHMAINSRHLTSLQSDALDRIKASISHEQRTLSAVLIDDPLTLDAGEGDDRHLEKYAQVMRAAGYLGAPLVRITVAPGDSSSTKANIDRTIAALRRLVPVARELGLKIAVAGLPASSLGAEGLRQIVKEVDPAVLGLAFEIESGEGRSIPAEDLAALAPHVWYLRVKATAFDKYGEETTIDYDQALSPFERSGYNATISIAFDGDTNPVTGVTKTRDLLVKHWVALHK